MARGVTGNKEACLHSFVQNVTAAKCRVTKCYMDNLMFAIGQNAHGQYVQLNKMWGSVTNCPDEQN